jgi:hypothetical protein
VQQHQQQVQQPTYAQLGPGPFPGSVELDSTGAIIQPDELAPRRATDGGAADLGEEDDDEYDDDDEEDDYDEDEEEDLVDDEIDEGGTDEADEGEDEYEDSPGSKHLAPSNHRAGTAAGGAHHHHHHHHHHAPKAADGREVAQEQSDFYTFGDGLTTIKGKSLASVCVPKLALSSDPLPSSPRLRPGGVLTVADDLLKNDSTRFLEMMEQLAERRMMREEAAIQMMADDERDLEDEDDEDLEDEDDEEE